MFKEKKVLVVGETFEQRQRGVHVRERLRAQFWVYGDPSEVIIDAVNLGTTYIGLEHLSPLELLQIARNRFRAARGLGDNLTVT